MRHHGMIFASTEAVETFVPYTQGSEGYEGRSPGFCGTWSDSSNKGVLPIDISAEIGT